MISIVSLIAGGIGPTQARMFEGPLLQVCERFEINTPLRQAAFVAQCTYETVFFVALEENLYYTTPERIMDVFSKVSTLEIARKLIRNPKALANCVYAGRNGNGSKSSGDGWAYRGRGLFQLTGRANYTAAGDALDRNYIEHPGLVALPEGACLTAGWYWSRYALNRAADRGAINEITRRINGPAMAGAKARERLYKAFLRAFA